jgi:hypothetical protein
MESIKLFLRAAWHDGLFGTLWELALWIAAVVNVVGNNTESAVLFVALIAVNRVGSLSDKIEGKSYAAGYRDCANETVAKLRKALHK